VTALLGLTPRQSEVLILHAEGLSHAEAADRLGLTEHTVKRHSEQVRKRFGVSKTRHAVRKAREEGLL
jgi:DNA-binding NarL/FixJ family response regulator